MNKKLIAWSLGAMLLASGVALFMTAPTTATAAEDTQPCAASTDENLALRIKELKEQGLEQFNLEEVKVPESITVSDDEVTFDPNVWELEDVGDGLIAFRKRPKKPKKRETYVTCLCGGSDSAGGCLTMVAQTSGKISCENTGCTNRGCGKAIFGERLSLSEAGFELP